MYPKLWVSRVTFYRYQELVEQAGRDALIVH